MDQLVFHVTSNHTSMTNPRLSNGLRITHHHPFISLKMLGEGVSGMPTTTSASNGLDELFFQVKNSLSIPRPSFVNIEPCLTGQLFYIALSKRS